MGGMRHTDRYEPKIPVDQEIEVRTGRARASRKVTAA